MGRRAPSIEGALVTADRAHDELVSFNDLDGACVRAEQGWCLRCDLLEDCAGVELGREKAAHARELLRERA